MRIILRENLNAIILIALIIVFAVGVAVVFSLKSPDQQSPVEDVAFISDKLYVNNTYNLSFKTPERYTVREAENMILIEDDKSNGVQILITPIDEDIPILTEELIRADIPEMIISDAQKVEIGENRTGLAFKSDNEAFDGASREVWFVWNGSLYQISTYERLDPLLKSIFATWEFI